VNGLISPEGLKVVLAAQQQLQRLAGVLEAEAGLVFREQALMDGFFSGVVHLVGDAGEVGVNAGELEVVVDLKEEIAQSGGVALAGAHQARQRWGQLLLDGLLENRTTHYGARREKAEEVAACSFV